MITIQQPRRTGETRDLLSFGPSSAVFVALLSLVAISCKPGPPTYRQPQDLIGASAPELKPHSVGSMDSDPELCTLRVIWATWCEPCKVELPAIDDWLLRLASPTNVELVLADDASDDEVVEFLSDNGVTYGSYTRQRRMLSAHGVRGVPTAYLIDAEGVVAGVHEGALTETTLGRLLAASNCSSDNR